MAAAFDKDGGFGAPASVTHFDSAGPAQVIIVPDAQLLFTADFRRAGPDLVLTGHDGRHHIIPGYFATEHRPALAAPSGARLSPNVVDLLAGSPTPNEYAQAAPTTPPEAIGKIEKVVGTATVVRNGVAVAINVGDAVYKSDVIQTGANSAVGVGFPDGTALNLVANTRMALNEYSFDPNSTSNGALLSLVEGTFSFVAGKVAHSGDMKIETPVATMGIGGTTGWVQEVATVTANAGQDSYSFAVVPDYGTNQSGMYDLIDNNGNVIAPVSQTGYVTLVTPQGIGTTPIVTTQPLTASQLQFEQQIVQQVFQTLNQLNNPNPQSNPSNGSSTPQSPQPNTLQQLLQEKGSPFNANTNTNGENNGNGSSAQNGSSEAESQPTTEATWLYGSGGNWDDPLNWSDGWAPLAWQTIEILQSVTVIIDSTNADSGPTATAALNLLIGPGAILEIVSGGSLSVSNIVGVFGLIEVNSTGIDPTFTAQGPVTVYASGEIEAIGSNAAVYFLDSVDNFGTIAAGDYGAVWFEQTTTTNEFGALIVASDHGTVTFDQGSVQNSGAIEAVTGGTVTFNQTSVTNEAGAVILSEAGGVLTFNQGSLDNFGSIIADTGALSLLQTTLTNEIGGLIEAENGGTLLINAGGGTIDNAGVIAAQNGGTVVLQSIAVDIQTLAAIINRA